MSWLPLDVGLASSLALIAVSFVASAVSATFGIGGGVLMLAALLNVTSPLEALAVHAAVQVGSNSGRTWLMWRSVDMGIMSWFVAGSVVGVAIASRWVVELPVAALHIALALFLLTTTWLPWFRFRSVPTSAFFPVGALSSFLTMFLGATGPILAAFMSPERLGRDTMVATHASCMTLQHLFKLIAFVYLGIALTAWFPLLGAMLGAGFAGTLMGRRLLRKFPDRPFRIAFRVILTLLALRLLVEAIGQ